MADKIDTIIARKIAQRPDGRVPMPEFSAIAVRFAAAIERTARDLFKTTTGAIITATEVSKQADTMERIAIPSMLGIARIPGLDTAAMINLSSELVFHLVDLRMGGDPTVSPVPTTRSLTAIDMELCEDFLAGAIDCFTRAMEETMGAPVARKLALAYMEQNVTQVSIAPPNADVMTIGLNLDIGEAARNADFELIIPLSVLDSLQSIRKPTETHGTDSAGGIWQDHMHQAALNCPVAMTAIMHRTKVSMGQIEDWRVGDIIPVPRSAVDELELVLGTADNQVYFAAARLGARDEGKGVRLTDDPQPEVTEHLRRIVDQRPTGA